MSVTAATHVKRYLRAAKPGAIPTPAPLPDFERHQRKCAICRHAEREAIEELFIYWHSASSITDLFDLPDWSTMYRHARAAGLYEHRRHNIRAVLEHLLESADGVEATPMSIVAAVRAYACLTDSGSWVEPAKRAIVTYHHSPNGTGRDTTELIQSEEGGAVPTSEEKHRRQDTAFHPERGRGAAVPIEAPASRVSTPEVAVSSVAEPVPARAVHGSRATHHKSPAPPSARTRRERSREGPDLQTSNLRPQTSSPSNRQSPELESPVSHSKQTTPPPSNRQIRQHPQRDLPLAQRSPAKIPKR